MSHLNMKKRSAAARLLPVVVAVVALLLAASAHAAVPGIKGSSFALSASDGYSSQPDGALIYSWGYSCAGSATVPNFQPFPPDPAFPNGGCPPMQLPGPTLIVTEGVPVTVMLTNHLPAAAGRTSIIFAGFQVSTPGCATQGVLTCEAAPGATVTYTFTPTAPGTHAYYSGTQPDLQIEMGLYGAVVVLPAAPAAGCQPVGSNPQLQGKPDYRLAISAYDNTATCYDREYLFQWGEMDPKIHRQAEEQVRAAQAVSATAPAPLNVKTEPYHPSYFVINGRSMPDDMDANYAPNYPNQPYNGNPHMHPGDMVLIRVIGQGRFQHPFHEHGNHVRILGRDGNLILAQGTTTTNAATALLAGRMEFTTDTTPGQAFDGIFYWSGKGLGWDIYGHKSGDGSTCTPNPNGYDTTGRATSIYYEWCADHNHALETNPIGNVAGGGPSTLPDPLIATNGPWFNGTPYLGPDAVNKSRGPTPLPPGGVALQNPPEESGIAFMWHSHNEREITTNDLFPGGMLMMMLVDPPVFVIDETL